MSGLPPLVREVVRIEVVVPNTLKESSERRRYYEFLTKNPDISPFQKLFGMSVTSTISAFDIKQQVRQISFVVHPDKNIEDSELCTELMAIINSTKDVALNHGLSPALELFASQGVFFENPIPQLEYFIERQKWKEAVSFIVRLSSEEMRESQYLAWLVVHVYFRLDMLTDAIAVIEFHSKEAGEAIRQCLNCVDLITGGTLSSSALSEELSQTKGWLHRLSATRVESFSSGTPQVFNGGFFSPKIFILLKDCYKNLGDRFNYEITLRESIRACPLEFSDKKSLLIEELKQLISYTAQPMSLKYLSSNCLKKAQNLLDDLSKQGLTRDDYEYINMHIRVLWNTYDFNTISEMLAFLHRIYTNDSHPTSSILSSFAKTVADQFGVYPAPYQDSLIDKIKKLYCLLNGFKSYMEGKKQDKRNDILIAASEFLTIEEWDLLGFAQIELNEFGNAVRSWSRQYVVSTQEVRQRQLLDNILFAMNSHDTMLVKTQLYELDTIQEKAIQKKMSNSN